MEDAISILVASGRDEDRNRILTVLTGHNDFNIAGIEKDETGAIIKSASLQPNVLILDLHLPGMSGTEIAPIIHRRSPSTVIVVLYDRDENDYDSRTLNSGISGLLLKEADIDKLDSIIKIVCSGGYYFSASIIIKILSEAAFAKQFPCQALSHKPNYQYFSPTERGIITHLAQGLSDSEIADYLNFNIGTIRNCISAIKRKTKLKSRIQIVIYSLNYGLIDFDQIDLFKNNGQFLDDTIQ